MKFEVIKGEREEIHYSGKRARRHTTLIRMGNRSLSQKALILGGILAACQLLDGILTYVGLSLLGVSMEGNTLLRTLMEFYGKTPVLFVSKLIALVLVVILTFEAHRRSWLRPVIYLLIVLYLALALIPWTYIISSENAKNALLP